MEIDCKCSWKPGLLLNFNYVCSVERITISYEQHCHFAQGITTAL